jgi:hypothetical protein
VTAAAGLSGDELAMLRFAGQWWLNPAAKEHAITERFGIAPVRFYQRVNALLDRPAAAATEPVIVARLRRIRAARGVQVGRRPRSTR